MKATIKDVAREAKVSIATVSNVINGKDIVKKETREKVTRVIEKLNYVPDQAARTMIRKKTNTIGMVVPSLSNEFWGSLAGNIQRQLLNFGYTLLILTTESDPKVEQISLNTLKERNVDGVIIASLGLGSKADKRYVEALLEWGIPLVSFHPYEKKLTTVWGDYMASSMEVVDHLISLGHTKIAYIGSYLSGIERELGYRNSLMLNRIPVDERLMISGQEEKFEFFSQYGYDCAKKLCKDNVEFTAIFCSNDLIAIGAIKAFEDLGMHVPADKAVVGFDDINMASLYRPALTTVRQPITEMASSAVTILIEQIEKPDTDHFAKTVTFPMKLIIRESSGAQI
ncbi:LacI family DNA-binding transcriptional regulator [Paenibacillus sp. NPDC058174]|uniref:LacI family DNA-binding transcriptional regulator n=1 Tax=Paenibacillus sp. NPDC058174 TaxID=3346366 RepID=UPI0036D91987